MFRLGLAVAVMVTGGVLAGAADDGGPSPAGRRPPASEHVVPDPTQRGVFVDDPKGQIERIAAIGHLVAWSVRTPADRLWEEPDPDSYYYPVRPLVLPARSRVVVADERGGQRLRLDLGKQWVNRLRMLRGPGGDAEPQLA